MAEFYATKADKEIARVVESAVYDMFRERAYFYRRYLSNSNDLSNEGIAASPACDVMAPFVMNVLQQELGFEVRNEVRARDAVHRFTMINDGSERIVDATYKQFIRAEASKEMPNVLVAPRQQALHTLAPVLKEWFKPTFY